MKLIKNNQEAYMGWHDGRPIWDRGIDKLLATPFYVESRGEAVVVTFKIRTGQWPGEPPYPHINPTVEYSFDDITWTTLPTLDGGYTRTVTIPANGRSYIRITGDRYDSLNDAYVYLPIIADKPHNVGGNVMSLLYGSEFMNYNTIPRSNALFRLFSMPSYTNETLIDASSLILPATTLTTGCYNLMFRGCVNMVSGPVLPATTLVSGCYMGMFADCSSLTTAPALPATTLANSCYHGMFEGCSSLTTAPALPATTLANNCYVGMFEGCSSLTTAPTLPATTLAQYCYYSMFSGCTGLTEAPVLPATTLANNCYVGMFRGCTGLTEAPELPATTLASSCYPSMFSGCTGLTEAPVLPATTLTQYCYYNMFNGCSNLNYIKCLAASISAKSCTSDWVDGVATAGTFVKKAGVTWPTGVNGIPEGWTVVEE